MRLAAQLVEAVVDSSLEHAILQEVNKGGGGADLCPGVVEGDVHVGMLLLLVHKGAQPWLAVRRQLVPVPYTSRVECTRGNPVGRTQGVPNGVPNPSTTQIST